MLVGEGVLDAADIMFLFATLAAVIAAVNAIPFESSYGEGDVTSCPVHSVSSFYPALGLLLFGCEH